MRRVGLVITASLSLAGHAFAQERDFGLAHVGSEASFIDLKSVKTVNGVASFDALVVARTGQPLVGGFRKMSVDCEANEFRTLSVFKVGEDGKLGPEEPLSGQIFPVGAGTPENTLAAVVCDKVDLPVRASGIVEATRIGRERLAAPKT
jgi:hypothetical protein